MEKSSNECVDGIVNRREEKTRIMGYQDLDVYKCSYQSMLDIYREILPHLPRTEYDLTDQLRRSSKAVPRLIAEGHSKRYQVRGFHKYIDDALAEANETVVSLCQVKDLCGDRVNRQVVEKLIDAYDKVCRQLYNLAASWRRYHDSRA